MISYENMKRSALLSGCGTYRWWLRREWSLRGGTVAFVGLNPSTADAEVDDPTIRRCIRFAQDWGFGSLLMVNLFAFRATDPGELYGAGRRATGDFEHLERLDQVFRPVDGSGAQLVVGAWGAHELAADRARYLMSREVLPRRHAVLGLTAAGQPRHPLYMPALTEPRWADNDALVRLPRDADDLGPLVLL